MKLFFKKAAGVLFATILVFSTCVTTFAGDYTAYWEKMATDTPAQFKTEARAYRSLSFTTVYTDMETYKNTVPMSILGEIVDYTVIPNGGCIGIIESISGFDGHVISFHSDKVLPVAKGDFATIYGVLDGYASYTAVDQWGIQKEVQTLSINTLIGETNKRFDGTDITQEMKDLFFGTYDVVSGYIGDVDWDDTTPDPNPDPNNPEYDQIYVHRKVSVSDTMVDNLPIKVHRYYQTVAGTIVMHFRFTGPNWEEYYTQNEAMYGREWYESSKYYERIEFDYDGTANFNVGAHYPIILDDYDLYSFDIEGLEHGSRESIQGDVLNEDDCKKLNNLIS